jgi:hypothetical protein
MFMYTLMRGITLPNQIVFVPWREANFVTFLLYHVLHVRKDAESYRIFPSVCKFDFCFSNLCEVGAVAAQLHKKSIPRRALPGDRKPLLENLPAEIEQQIRFKRAFFFNDK